MQKQAQVLSVESRPVRNGQGSMYIVKLSDGSSWSTFDPAIGNQAHQASAAVVGPGAPLLTLEVEEKPNPNRPGQSYTNLLGIYGPGQAPAQPAGVPQFAGSPPPFQGGGAPPIPQTASPSGGGRGMDPETVLRITRLSAVATAGALVGSLFDGAGDVNSGVLLGKVIEISEAIVNYAFSGNGAAGQVVYPTQVEQTPQAVAAFVGQELGAGVVQVGAPVAAGQIQPGQALPTWLQ